MAVSAFDLRDMARGITEIEKMAVSQGNDVKHRKINIMGATDDTTVQVGNG